MGKLDFAGTADRDLSGKKYSGRSFSLDSILLSFDFNCGKARTGNYMPTCRNHPKDGDNTCDCFIAGSF